MDLIDRYLVAVRRQLPPDLQDDVVAELTDSLRSEAEEHERDAGRPMTADEQSAMLKKRGHPIVMASRYLPQQYLIGPALYPYYRQALKVVVFWVVLPIALVSGAIHAISDGTIASLIARTIAAAWNGAIYSVGIVTIVFTIFDHERLRIRVHEDWNPKKLPEPERGRFVPRSESVLSLVFAITFLAWWIGLVRVPDLPVWGDEPMRFVLAPVWSQLYYPILLVLVASIVVYLIDLIRPWRTFTVSVIDIVVAFLHVVIVVIVLRAWHLVDVTGAPQQAEQLSRIAYLVNNTARGVFMAIGVVSVFDILYELWKLLGSRQIGRV